MMEFWLILGVVVFFDLWFWALEDVGDRLWPPTDEELRDRAAYRIIPSQRKDAA